MIYTGPKFYQHHQRSWPWPWGRGHRLRILKMLKFSFMFLRPQYFLTLSPIWFIFGLMIHIGPKFCAVLSPFPSGHVKIKVTDLEFSRHKMCNIRRAILSGDRSCLEAYWRAEKQTGSQKYVAFLLKNYCNNPQVYLLPKIQFLNFCWGGCYARLQGNWNLRTHISQNNLPQRYIKSMRNACTFFMEIDDDVLVFYVPFNII